VFLFIHCGVTSLQGDYKEESAFDGISKTSVANGDYGASSSGSHEDLYPDDAVPGNFVILRLSYI
jgi:hypothetical protein